MQVRNLRALPQWQWDLQGQNIQLQSLLQQMTHGKSAINIAGKGQLKLQATAIGANQDNLLRSLTGAGEFNVQTGSVQGIDLNYLVQAAEAMIEKEPVSVPANLHLTSFDSLTGSFSLGNGVIDLNPVVLKSKVFFAEGAGSIEMRSEVMDFKVKIKSKSKNKFKWEIPVTISGTLSHPSVGLDTLAIQKFLASEKVKKVKQKVIQQIRKHLSGQAKDFLEQLLQ
jgi:AsmA protein